MTDFPTTMRSVEDFLINPTFNMEDRSVAIMDSDRHRSISAMQLDRMIALKPGKQTPEPSATIRDLIDEPIFWRGYTSEEEVASPIDADDMSFHSSSASLASLTASECSFPEQLAHSCNRVEQQCARAQAVTLLPAGKARVISMPKLVDVSGGPRIKRSSPGASIHTPASRTNLLEVGSRISSQQSRTNSCRSSSERSPVSTAPSSPPQSAQYPTIEKFARRRPSLPNLHGPSQQYAAHTVSRFTHASSFLKYDPYPSNDLAATPTTPTTPTSPSRRRLGKFSSTFNLSRFGKGLVRKNSSDSNSGPDVESVKEPEPVLYSRSLPPLQIPNRNSSVKPKLTPRGASEREPPLVLPPCPEGYESDHDYSLASHWPPRKDSGAVHVTVDRATKSPKLHKRQRSMSAALVSTQA